MKINSSNEIILIKHEFDDRLGRCRLKIQVRSSSPSHNGVFIVILNVIEAGIDLSISSWFMEQSAIFRFYHCDSLVTNPHAIKRSRTIIWVSWTNESNVKTSIAPVENFWITKIGTHFHANVHIASDKVQIIKWRAHFEHRKPWNSNTYWWRIATSHATLVQNCIVHEHFEFKWEILGMVRDVDAAKLP